MATRNQILNLLGAVACGLGALLSLNCFLFFAWLTAGPPVMENGVTRPRTPAEIQEAVFRANAWLSISVVLLAAAGVFAYRFIKGRK